MFGHVGCYSVKANNMRLLQAKVPQINLTVTLKVHTDENCERKDF